MTADEVVQSGFYWYKGPLHDENIWVIVEWLAGHARFYFPGSDEPYAKDELGSKSELVGPLLPPSLL